MNKSAYFAVIVFKSLILYVLRKVLFTNQDLPNNSDSRSIITTDSYLWGTFSMAQYCLVCPFGRPI